MKHYGVPFGKYRLMITALFLLGAATIFLALTFSARIVIHSWRTTNNYYTQCKQQTEHTASTIADFLQQQNTIVAAIAQQLQTAPVSPDIIRSALAQKPKELSGLGYLDLTTNQLWYYVERNGTQEQISRTVDASFLDSLRSSATHGSTLKRDPITNMMTYYYAVPVANETRRTGLVFSAQSMNHIRHVLTSLFVGQKSYWLATDATSQLLIHPFTSWVNEGKTIRALGAKIPVLLDDVRQSRATASSSYANEITGNDSWIFLTPVGSTGIILGGVFDTNEIPISNDYYRQSIFVCICLWTIALIVLALGLSMAFRSFSTTHLWLSSLSISLLLLCALAASWAIAHRFPHLPSSGTPIVSKAHLYTLLDAYSSKTKKESAQPVVSDRLDTREFSRMLNYRYKTGRYVPTGFLINDIQMKSQDSIEFVAFVWQRYFDGIHDGISRGFILPQIASKPTITEISRSRLEKSETIIWQVRSELNQNFSYQKYPFDVKNIDFQIRHKDFDKQITLVPDIDAYAVLNPAALPGVGNDTSIINWQLRRSYYSYQLEQFNTNFGLYAFGPFGIYEEVSLDHIPELHFNVVTQRYLVDTLVSDLLPPCVIAVILFVLLLTYFAEGTFELLLETSAAAFFSTVFAQVQFRSKIPSNEFVYFELFYFTLYGLILLILCTTLIHMFKIRIPIIDYKNNIVTKLLYWPLLFAVLLTGTVHYLYL